MGVTEDSMRMRRSHLHLDVCSMNYCSVNLLERDVRVCLLWVTRRRATKPQISASNVKGRPVANSVSSFIMRIKTLPNALTQRNKYPVEILHICFVLPVTSYPSYGSSGVGGALVSFKSRGGLTTNLVPKQQIEFQNLVS
jgi:hypothetical protein